MTSTDKTAIAHGDTDDAFRRAMRLHAASVCILTVGSGEDVNGMAATAVTSFSMSPPALLACVNKTASIASLLSIGFPFGVTLLGRSHQDVAATFSRKPIGSPRFSDMRWVLAEGRLPTLKDAVANLACVVERSWCYGTHNAVVGRVTDVVIGTQGEGLIYRDGVYL